MLPNEVGGVDESSDIEAIVDVTELTTEVGTELGAEPMSPDVFGVKLLAALTGLVIWDIRSPLRLEGLLDLLLDVGLGSGWESNI